MDFEHNHKTATVYSVIPEIKSDSKNIFKVGSSELRIYIHQNLDFYNRPVQSQYPIRHTLYIVYILSFSLFSVKVWRCLYAQAWKNTKFEYHRKMLSPEYCAEDMLQFSSYRFKTQI